MSVNSRIEAALSPLGIPLGFQELEDGTYIKAFPSITYFSYLDQPEGWAEDVETEHGWYYQVEVWSDTNYLDLVNDVIAALRADDWGYLNGQDQTHYLTPNDPIYHKVMRFKLTTFS